MGICMGTYGVKSGMHTVHECTIAKTGAASLLGNVSHMQLHQGIDIPNFLYFERNLSIRGQPHLLFTFVVLKRSVFL